eukprot:298371-Pyramimonas_sp.AAC.1
MDIFWPPGAKLYTYPSPAGAPGRRFPGGGYGQVPALHFGPPGRPSSPHRRIRLEVLRTHSQVQRHHHLSDARKRGRLCRHWRVSSRASALVSTAECRAGGPLKPPRKVAMPSCVRPAFDRRSPVQGSLRCRRFDSIRFRWLPIPIRFDLGFQFGFRLLIGRILSCRFLSIRFFPTRLPISADPIHVDRRSD